MVKHHLPKTRTIVGGPHISSMAVETMQRFTEFDVAVVNEGESVLVNLLEALRKGVSLKSVNGILFRENHAVVTTPRAPIIDDLDNLPIPAWDLLKGFPDEFKPAIFDYPSGPVATIAASRGCPFHCKFCDTSTFGARVRAYSPEAVYSLMKHLKENYGIRHIMFVDDQFLASRIRTSKLCELLIENKLNMTWSCTARVDTAKPDVLKLMKKAGCWEISFGLESGSNDLLQKMDKLARIELSEQAVNWTHSAGIRCKGLFMLGYPGETMQTIEQTKAFLLRLPMTTMNLSKFTPHPGSPIYRDICGTNIKEDHWKKMNGMNFVWSLQGLTVEELDREYQYVLLSFYKQKRVMHKCAIMAVRYPIHILRFCIFGLGFVKAKLNSFKEGRRGVLIKTDHQNLDEGFTNKLTR